VGFTIGLPPLADQLGSRSRLLLEGALWPSRSSASAAFCGVSCVTTHNAWWAAFSVQKSPTIPSRCSMGPIPIQPPRGCHRPGDGHVRLLRPEHAAMHDAGNLHRGRVDVMGRHDLLGQVALELQHVPPQLGLHLAEPARRVRRSHPLSIDERLEVRDSLLEGRDCRCRARNTRGGQEQLRRQRQLRAERAGAQFLDDPHQVRIVKRRRIRSAPNQQSSACDDHTNHRRAYGYQPRRSECFPSGLQARRTPARSASWPERRFHDSFIAFVSGWGGAAAVESNVVDHVAAPELAGSFAARSATMRTEVGRPLHRYSRGERATQWYQGLRAAPGEI
jgi:hypothetical protein